MLARAEAGPADDRGARRLSWPERRQLALLGFPAAGLAFAVTATSTYVPVLVEKISGPVMVGLLVGGEGFFGMFVPLLVGGWADRSSTVAGRLRWVAASGVLLAAAVATVGVLGVLSAGLGGFGIVLCLLYIGYYAYLAPYWALYPDLVPDQESGRSRSVESTWRVVGVGLALIGGGLLLSLSPGLPFFVAAGLVALVTVTLLAGLRSRSGDTVGSGRQERGTIAEIRELLRSDPSIRRLMVANALWNFALSGLRAFVVLFFTAGVGRPASFVSTVIFPLVAVGIAVAAPLAGWLADKWGHARVLMLALMVYGGSMWVPGVLQQTWVAALIPVVAAGAATVMTLPESVLMRLLPEDKHGAGSGLFGLSRGVGGTLGPLAAGAAILLLRPLLSATHGYGAMWLICSAALLVSLPVLWPLRHDERL